MRKLLQPLLLLLLAPAAWGDVVCTGTANTCGTAFSGTSTTLVGTTSVCGGAAADTANSVCLSANTLTAEGATGNAFETIFAFGDASADGTVTFTANAAGVQISPGAGTAALPALNIGGTAGIFYSGSAITMSDSGGNGCCSFSSTNLYLRSDSFLTWMSTATPIPGTRDTGLTRSAAGIVQVTAGLSGFGTLLTGGVNFDRTITAAGTTGAQTINKSAGTVNFAAAATTLVVTNSTITTSSLCSVQARTNDATCSVKDYETAAGSFTIRMNAACTAETSVGFVCFN